MIGAWAMVVLGLQVVAPSTPTQDATPAAVPTEIRNPHWARLPSGSDLEAHYPTRASRSRVAGAAIMRCVSDARGMLKDCRILAEAPAGEGFGPATLDLASRFRLAEPLEGATVTIPMRWIP